jgi:cellulose biosynthesis protein BcsQ
LASLVSLEAFLTDRDREAAERLYLLNQFDTALPLHQDMREMLQQQLGDRLLPLVLRRSPAVSEALVEGMTVIDYAPGSTAAEDYWALAGWLRSFAAPAIVGYGGVRWSER